MKLFDQTMGVITATALICLGIYIGRRSNTNLITTETRSRPFYCAYSKTEIADDDDPYKYEIYPCGNEANVTIGGRTLCQDHYDCYLAEMSGVLGED